MTTLSLNVSVSEINPFHVKSGGDADLKEKTRKSLRSWRTRDWTQAVEDSTYENDSLITPKCLVQ